MRSDNIIVPNEPRRDKRPIYNNGYQSVSSLELVQMRLTSALPIFSQFFAEHIDTQNPPGLKDADAQSVTNKPKRLFSEEGSLKGYAEYRLSIGLEEWELPPRFGVWSLEGLK